MAQLGDSAPKEQLLAVVLLGMGGIKQLLKEGTEFGQSWSPHHGIGCAWGGSFGLKL